MTDRFEEQLAEQRRKLEAIKGEMEQVRQEFLGRVARYLSRWYLEEARAVVERCAGVTNRRGPAAVKQLKEQVNALAERARKIADEYVGSPNLWIHLDPEAFNGRLITPDDPYELRPLAFPGAKPTVEDAVRLAMGMLGRPLDAAGYLAGHGPSDEARLWRPIRPLEWRRVVGAEEHYYASSMEWPDDLKEGLALYRAKLTEAVAVERRMAAIRDQQAKANATDLWDSL